MKYIRNKMQDPTFTDVDYSNCSSFIFKVNQIFMEEKDNVVKKVVVGEE